MESQVANLLVDSDHGELYENYSGRGMYGEETTGVTFEDMDEFHNSIAHVLKNGSSEERELLGEFLQQGVRIDNLGHDIIIY